MKRNPLTLLAPIVLLIACHHNDNEAVTPKNTMSATLDGKTANITEMQATIDPVNTEMLSIVASLDGNHEKLLVVGMAYKTMKEGESVELEYASSNSAYIMYTPNNWADTYAAGPSQNGHGQITVTKNDLKGRKIEGNFNGSLRSATEALPCSNGKFSVVY